MVKNHPGVAIEDDQSCFLGGGLTYIFNFHPENWGNDSHFDEHIFQVGWFNHQLVKDVLAI